MEKQCKKCNSQFEITEDDLKFYDKVSPVFDTKKYVIPSPTLCPECRLKRRVSFQNERNLYPNRCDKCQKDIIGMYSPDKNEKVLCQPCWWSDENDLRKYGKDIDFSKSFFEQCKELLQSIPKLALINDYNLTVNAEYINFCGGGKNVYLLFDSEDCENCMYGHTMYYNTSCLDCINLYHSQYCYQCIYCTKGYKLFFSMGCENCSESQFLYNCKECEHCMYCYNLQHKKYCIKNKQYSKEEYEKIVLEMKNTPEEGLKAFRDFLDKNPIPRKYYSGHSTQSSTGDYMQNIKNCKNVFEVRNLEDCAHTYRFFDSKDCQDCHTWGLNAEMCYENINIGTNIYHSSFNVSCWDNIENLYYSYLCRWTKNSFGCFGLKKYEYCILNKEYSKEEYEKLVPKIIEHMMNKGEWGEFFPSHFSSFGYNESIAQGYFPLSKENAILNGFHWSDYESPKPNVEKIIPGEKLPNTIASIPDDILNWAIECEITKKPFRITKQELQFYRDHNLPIPRRHPDQRHQDRMSFKNPKKLWRRNCMKCKKDIETSYAPDRSEIVYCEDCYLKEVY